MLMPTQQFILLPPQGLRAVAALTPRAHSFLVESERALGARDTTLLSGLRVLDSIRADGPKLVELTPAAQLALKAQFPGLRVVPVVFFRPQFVRETIVWPIATTKATRTLTLSIVSAGTGQPLRNAFVAAFTDFEARRGAQGVTNAKGEVKLALGAARKAIERLYIYPEAGHWGTLRRELVLKTGGVIQLIPIDLGYTDALRYFYGNQPLDAGRGITVGVIDTGIDLNHPDLQVDGGQNTVQGEDPADFGDNGEHHGTHVAGIIAARGTPPEGVRGLAPGVRLRSYRVFGKADNRATNFAIAKAIDRAVTDGCDIINMSLGNGPADETTTAAISDARAQGSIVIVAAGNDDRSPVSFPASLAHSVAVSAMGRKGTFPRRTTQFGDVAAPYGQDRHNFIAAFSNIGPEIALTGPGVGIISTVPGGYAVMDGTSMACPAASGAAAAILSKLPDVLGMPRTIVRSSSMLRAIYKTAHRLEFGEDYEGQGILTI